MENLLNCFLTRLKDKLIISVSYLFTGYSQTEQTKKLMKTLNIQRGKKNIKKISSISKKGKTENFEA